MANSNKYKGIAILTAAAIGGLAAGTAIKPTQAASVAGVSPHAITASAPTTQPNSCSSKNGCQGKNNNSCSSKNGCLGK